jgi:hypothetical protein
MNNKDLTSLMEAYDNVTTPDSQAAVSTELSTIASTDVQSSPEGDNEQEEVDMVHTNLKTLGQHLNEIGEALGMGREVEPWMQDKIAVATDSIVNVANAILHRQ